MNLTALKTRLAERMGANSASLPTLTDSRYGHALNETHRAVLRMPGMEALRRAQMTFDSTAGTAQYALPTEGVARVDRIWDTVNRRVLAMREIEWLRHNDPRPYSGLPWGWIPAGYVEVFTQPTAADSLFVKSTAAGDTTQTAYVEGFTTGGYYRTASVTLTGTTAVNVAAAISTWTTVTKFYLSAVAVGTVSLYQTSGAGAELSRITIGKTRAQYYSLILESVPVATVTYTCDVLRGIPDMTNGTDEPLLPEDFHDLLLDGAESREMRKADDPQRWKLVMANYAQGLTDLKTFLRAHPDYKPSLGRDPVLVGTSTLGAYFPADTWLP